jgi:hypothetical protein
MVSELVPPSCRNKLFGFQRAAKLRGWVSDGAMRGGVPQGGCSGEDLGGQAGWSGSQADGGAGEQACVRYEWVVDLDEFAGVEPGVVGNGEVGAPGSSGFEVDAGGVLQEERAAVDGELAEDVTRGEFHQVVCGVKGVGEFPGRAGY